MRRVPFSSLSRSGIWNCFHSAFLISFPFDGREEAPPLTLALYNMRRNGDEKRAKQIPSSKKNLLYRLFQLIPTVSFPFWVNASPKRIHLYVVTIRESVCVWVCVYEYAYAFIMQCSCAMII